MQWLRTLARAAVGTASESPYAQTTTARIVRIKLDRKVPYQIDGGEREKVKSLRIVVEPGAVEICVPGAADAASAG